jgi:hypothetical protein
MNSFSPLHDELIKRFLPTYDELMFRTIYVGVHDWYDCRLHQWFHTYHFHQHSKNMFKLGLTENGDAFGRSAFMEDPDEDYESFAYGGEIKLLRCHNCLGFHNTYKNFTLPGKVSRDEFEDYMDANNGEVTET